MTQQILKSSISGVHDFPARVAEFAIEMKNWRAHMARVKQEEKNDVVIAADRHMPLRRPSSHPMVERAINEKDEADFEIVDDGPTPAQVLATKKHELLSRVTQAESDATHAILPRGKRRLMSMRETDILLEEADERRRRADAAGIGDKIKSVFVDAKDPSEQRSDEDARFMDTQADIKAKMDKVARIAAQAHSDIEDLTLDNIDAWKLPTF